MKCIEALDALAQETRLAAFRLLVVHAQDGLLAGEIARQLGVPHNTLSSHLAILERAGLIAQNRSGRTITYRAELSAIRNLVVFLLRDCCGGKPELCAPVITEISNCCTGEGKSCA
jgi:DNA-binding transcriptional ArsR family regulator